MSDWNSIAEENARIHAAYLQLQSQALLTPQNLLALCPFLDTLEDARHWIMSEQENESMERKSRANQDNASSKI